MAAAAWAIYNEFKKYFADGTVDMDGDVFKLALFSSASNADTATLSQFNEITNEIAVAGGYAAGGKTISAVTWAVGASAGEMRFDATAKIFTASGANLSIISFAVIYDNSTGTSAGDRKLVCYSKLSTSQFSVTSGNTLTVTPSANGYFELN